MNMQKDVRRRFTKRQAEQRLIVCGNKCEKCGRELSNGFHMHHVVRHADHGATRLTNCMALCRTCHREIHHAENL